LQALACQYAAQNDSAANRNTNTTALWIIIDFPSYLASGDYDDGEFGGMKIGKGNRSTHRKPAQGRFIHHKSHLTRPWIEPRLLQWEASD
jgi:hypothetical protein